MAELLIRAGAQDTALMERVLTGPSDNRPSRLVVDAHVAAASPRVAAAAVAAGVPFLVDPQTYHLQDYQHPAAPWAQLPFARAEISTPADLLTPGRADEVAAGAVKHQLAHGATMVLAPYVHIGRPDDGWTQVQAALWHATRRYLDQQGLSLAVVAVVAIGWQLLDRPTWPQTLDPLLRSLPALNPSEVALAASRVDAGAHPEHRLASLIAVIGRISASYPVIAWQQGALGEAAVAAGAIGYECGIGWRERCDLGSAMTRYRRLSPTATGLVRPVYIQALRRSIPKATLRGLVAKPGIIAELTCLEPTCCPNGRRDLLQDARQHAISSRLRSLRDLTTAVQPAWRWHHLARASHTGLALAERINTVATRGGGISRIDCAALRATFSVADHRRQTLGGRRVA